MNRYPGIRPFRQDERHLFFGRNADAERLLRLVRNEQVVVLYGKSGYGKSSLLNAGLYPRISEEGRYRHWEIRFGPHKPGESVSPADALCNTVGVPGAGGAVLFPEKIFGKNLWQALKNRQAAEGATRFILFFDQFEELFSYPPEQILAFRQQLAEALYNATPEAALRAFEQSKNQPAAAEDLLYTPFELKVVFSIRADRMSLLKQLEDYLPNLLRHCFLLEALDEKQATDAVLLPAALPQVFPASAPQSTSPPTPPPRGRGDDPGEGNFTAFSTTSAVAERKPPSPSGEGLGERLTGEGSHADFATPPFSYAPATLAAIFQALRDDSGRIETSALQIVCKHVEDNIVTKRDAASATPITVTPSELGDLKAVFRAFYDNTIAALDPAEQPAARRLVEDVLIKDGIRLPFAEQALRTEPGVTAVLLEKLERASLLRVELDEQRRKIYEVGHDTLVGPIEEAAKVRREVEAQEAERQRLREVAERQKADKLKIDQDRRRNILFGLGALALLFFALIMGWRAFEAQELADKKSADVEVAERRVQNALDSLRIKSAVLAIVRAEADTMTARAQQSADAQAAAMIQLGYSTEQVVDGLAQNAKNFIQELKYPEALSTLEAAAKYRRTSFIYTNTALEIIYFFNEAGQTGARRQALALLGLDTNLGQADAKKVRDHIRRRDPLWYGVLERRYNPQMLPIKGGTFDLTNEDGAVAYRATIADFALAETETTFFQFALFCFANNRPLKPHRPSWGFNGDHPATQISWYDACLYANWRSKQLGLDTVYILINHQEPDDDYCSETYTVSIRDDANGFRLPTETEWQFAAGGGEYGLKYGMTTWAGTSSEDSLKYFANISGEKDGYEFTSPAGYPGRLRPNPLGLYDMSGNVWEWCWDWYGEYPTEPKTDWSQPEQGSHRVLRGGDWDGYAGHCRATRRTNYLPGYRLNTYGFRLASSPQ